jgi:hypothetical protein
MFDQLDELRFLGCVSAAFTNKESPVMAASHITKSSPATRKATHATCLERQLRSSLRFRGKTTNLFEGPDEAVFVEVCDQ